VLDHGDAELLQPLVGTVRRVAGQPDLDFSDRLRLRQCLGELAVIPEGLLGPQEPIDRQQDNGRSLTGVSYGDVLVDVARAAYWMKAARPGVPCSALIASTITVWWRGDSRRFSRNRSVTGSGTRI
jgi:hypothetical protein